MATYSPGTGLAGFDEQDAADALAALGQSAQTQPPAFDPSAPAPIPPPPVAPQTPVDTAPPIPSTAPSAPAPVAPTTDTVVSATQTVPAPAPGPAATTIPDEQPKPVTTSDLGPMPTRPKLTGDPTKDIQNNLEWSRQLSDYHTALEKKQGEIAKRDADVEQRKAEREADAERAAQTQRQAEVDAYQQQRQTRQQQIDDAVKEKQATYEDVKKGDNRSWLDRIAGAVAIAVGGYGQGLMLKGHVAGAQNEGLNAVNAQIAAEDQRRRDRLKAAGEQVLEARYGYKDSADNFRAGLNDIDADRAAKFRLIAKEAEEQLRQGGASDQDIKTNSVVVNSLQEASKAEDAIHAREEAQDTQRAHYRVEEQQHKEDQQIRRQQLGLAYENARNNREDRQQAKEDRKATADLKGTSSEFDKDESRLMGTSRTPGVVPKWREVRELGDGLREAIASGDTQAQAAAAIRVQEKISRLNTGAAPSHEQMKLFDSLQGTPEQKTAQLKQLLGDPKVSEQLLGGLMKVVDQSDEGMLKQIDADRQGVMKKYLGPNGGAVTPEQRRHALGRIAGIFDNVTTRTDKGAVPRYQNDPSAAAPAPVSASTPAAPAARPKLTGDDALKMLDAHNRGDSRFDGILNANGLI